MARATDQEVANLRSLLRFASREVVGRLRTDDPYAVAILIALFSRVTTTLQALVLLVERGFGQQAMMLNRAAFELMVDAYWVASNRELANERLVQHARFHHHLKRKLAKRYPDFFDNSSMGDEEELTPAELDSLTDLYSRHGTGSWTGLNLHQRVEAIVKDFDEHDRHQLRFFRDIVHRLNNEELHPTSRSIARVLRRRPTNDLGEVLQFRVASEPELGEMAIRSAWWMYLQLLQLLIETFDMPLQEELRVLRDEADWPNSE